MIVGRMLPASSREIKIAVDVRLLSTMTDINSISHRQPQVMSESNVQIGLSLNFAAMPSS